MQEQRIHYAEHSRGRTDSDRERRDDHRGQKQILAQHADCILHIVQEIVDNISFSYYEAKRSSSTLSTDCQARDEIPPTERASALYPKRQLPLHAASTSKDQWLVQGAIKDKEGRTQVGGAFGVFINKHTGCLKVVERTK